MSGIIYVTRCLVTGKLYVGLHTQGRKYYLGSGKALLAAVKKYGRKNFIRTDVDAFLLLEEGQAKEKIWIAALDSKAPNGYNITDGGEGAPGWHPNDEQRKRLSEVRMGHPVSAETRTKIAASKIGIPRSSECRAKLRMASVGNANSRGCGGWHHSPEARAKISASLVGNTRAKRT